MDPVEQSYEQDLHANWTLALRKLRSDGYGSADAVLVATQDRLRLSPAAATLAKSAALRGTLAFLADQCSRARTLLEEALLQIDQLPDEVPELEVTTRLTLVDACLKLGEKAVVEDEIVKCVSIACTQAQIDARTATSIWDQFRERMTGWRRFRQLSFYWAQYVEHVAIRQTPWNQAVAIDGLVEAQGMAGDKDDFIKTAVRQLKLMAEADSSKRHQPLLAPLVRSCLAFSMAEPLERSNQALKDTLSREPLMDGDVPLLVHVAAAEILRLQDKPAEALRLLTSHEVDCRVVNLTPVSKLSSIVRARCHVDLRNLFEARADWLEALASADGSELLTPRLRFEALSGVARACDGVGKYSEARPAYEAAAKFAEQVLPEGDFELSRALYDLAEAERIAGREGWQTKMSDVLLLEQGKSRTKTRFYALLLRKLGEHALATGQVADAVARLVEALAIYETEEFDVDERCLRIATVLARAMKEIGQDGTPTLRNLIGRIRSNADAEPLVLTEALLDLAKVEFDLGQLEMAESLLDEAAHAEAARNGPNDGTHRLAILELRAILCLASHRMDQAIDLTSQISEIHDARFIELFHAGSIDGARLATAQARPPVERLVWALSLRPEQTQEQVHATYTLAVRRKGIESAAFRLRNDSGLPDRTGTEREIQSQRAALASRRLIGQTDTNESTEPSDLDRNQIYLSRSVPEDRLRTHLLDTSAADIFDGMSASQTVLIDVLEVQGFLKEKSLVAFIVNGRPDTPVGLVSLGNSSEIGPVVDRLIDSIQSGLPVERWSSDAKNLAGLVLTGIDLQWAPDQLAFAPEGALLRLPIDILLLKDGQHVLDRFATRVVLSGREALSDLHPRRMSGDRFVIANPSFGASATGTGSASPHADHQGEFPFEQLPGTAREGAAVLQRLGNAAVLSEHEATKASLTRIRSPEFLHIATHGFAVPFGTPYATDDLTVSLSAVSEPLLRCGLALADANSFSTLRKLDRSESGILWGTDILELDVRGTELVYLSACHSGVGDISLGPASSSLALAFWLAGARSIVMTHWAIEDDSAVQVASAFYDEVISGQSYIRALRTAKLAARRAGASPCDWAAFSLFGESIPLFTYGGTFVMNVDYNKLAAEKRQGKPF
jgi:CHAT domain-containing protein/tetratricopeptide (TPR) repeat protein